jgi:hypothetical protein
MAKALEVLKQHPDDPHAAISFLAENFPHGLDGSATETNATEVEHV